MSEDDYFRYTHSVLIVPMVAVLIIWTVFYIEVRFGVNFNQYGVYPRTFEGLRGIFLSPFIHGSLQHLYNNTLPLAILLASLLYFYRDISFKVLGYGLLLTGAFTWLVGRPSYHIGASGLIYLLASFIFFKGIFTRHYRLVALSLIVVFIYGGLLWLIFPLLEGISWESHLGGFLSGLFLAASLHTKVPPAPTYSWEADDYKEEEDEFLQQFDEDGNFIGKGTPPEQDKDPLHIRYIYRKKKEEDEEGS